MKLLLVTLMAMLLAGTAEAKPKKKQEGPPPPVVTDLDPLVEEFKASGGSVEVTTTKMVNGACIRREVELAENRLLSIGSDGCMGKLYTHPVGMGRIEEVKVIDAMALIRDAMSARKPVAVADATLAPSQ